MAIYKMKHPTMKVDEIGGTHGIATREQIEILKRVFRGMELKDATADIFIHVTASDIEKAVRNDLEHCVFARSCSRMFESHVMVFLSSVAYVDLDDEDGIRRAFRFLLSEKMRNAIKSFDETGLAETGTYKMTAPRVSRKLDHLRASSRDHRKRRPDLAKKKNERGKSRLRVLMNGARPS